MGKLKFLAVLFVSACAGAQTVTVGTLSSTQSGSTTTITVPVSVAVPPATTTTSSSGTLASLIVQGGTSDGSSVMQTLGQTFTTISLGTVVVDSASGWNRATSMYTVPTTGTYLIISHLRLVDNATPGLSYGQGVNTANVDGATFTWVTTAGPRNVLHNERVVKLTAGQTIDLFAYADTSRSLGVNMAALSVQQLQ